LATICYGEFAFHFDPRDLAQPFPGFLHSNRAESIFGKLFVGYAFTEGQLAKQAAAKKIRGNYFIYGNSGLIHD
jgi:hypothetical protein